MYNKKKKSMIPGLQRMQESRSAMAQFDPENFAKEQ
jgi:hypothetical protein